MRPFQVSLTAVPKAGSAHVQQWLVSGLVKLPFLVIPSHYDLNREIPRGHKIEDAVFTVRCFEPISDITINSDSGALATDVRRVSADNFEVRLTFADRFTKAIGKITTRIRVSARGAKGAIFEPQLVTLSGAVVGPLKVTPDHFHFGLQNIGTDVEGKFVIRSRRDEFFRLVRIDGTFGKGDLTFEPVQRPFEYRRELEVPFQERIRHPGDREDAVDFLLELKDTREQFQERALVRYHGVESKGGG